MAVTHCRVVNALLDLTWSAVNAAASLAAVQRARLKGLQQRRQHGTTLAPRRVRNYNNQDDGMKVVGVAAQQLEALV